jgi:hypothetical protein
LGLKTVSSPHAVAVVLPIRPAARWQGLRHDGQQRDNEAREQRHSQQDGEASAHQEISSLQHHRML